MFGRHRIAIDRALFARVQRLADRSGYSSADEFITHIIEREVAELEQAASDEEVRRRLKGLGYLG